ncbi:hypothetical protein DFJ73DRAFT_629693 [Zopfochytrium polystomum]|nr:hypothetical protein DFJ73DRAFT_629693 [Zopfochytrium polystomum]
MSLDANIKGQHLVVHIRSSRNNTCVTLTDHAGNILCWASGGTLGFKKSQRNTSDVGYQAVSQLAEKAAKKNVLVATTSSTSSDRDSKGVEVRFKGFGPGREMAFRAIRALGWQIKRISDVTPIRHAGCRPPKARRL